MSACGSEHEQTESSDQTETTEHTSDNATGVAASSVAIVDANFDANFEARDWTDDTHRGDTAPDFEEVFDDTEVKRLDLVVRSKADRCREQIAVVTSVVWDLVP